MKFFSLSILTIATAMISAVIKQADGFCCNSDEKNLLPDAPSSQNGITSAPKPIYNMYGNITGYQSESKPISNNVPITNNRIPIDNTIQAPKRIQREDSLSTLSQGIRVTQMNVTQHKDEIFSALKKDNAYQGQRIDPQTAKVEVYRLEGTDKKKLNSVYEVVRAIQKAKELSKANATQNNGEEAERARQHIIKYSTKKNLDDSPTIHKAKFEDEKSKKSKEVKLKFQTKIRSAYEKTLTRNTQSSFKDSIVEEQSEQSMEESIKRGSSPDSPGKIPSKPLKKYMKEIVVITGEIMDSEIDEVVRQIASGNGLSKSALCIHTIKLLYQKLPDYARVLKECLKDKCCRSCYEIDQESVQNLDNKPPENTSVNNGLIQPPPQQPPIEEPIKQSAFRRQY